MVRFPSRIRHKVSRRRHHRMGRYEHPDDLGRHSTLSYRTVAKRFAKR